MAFRWGARAVLVPVDAAAAGRVLRLPGPSAPPPGRLEQVAWLLLSRAAPFDPLMQAHLAGVWGLPVPAVLACRAAQACGSVGQRVPGVLRRVEVLIAGCQPPSVLVRGVDLMGQVPALTGGAVRQVLWRAGLSDGDAGARLLRELAGLWGLPVAGTALWPGRVRQEQLAGLVRQVRLAGALRLPEPSAGERDWLAAAACVHWSGGHLVAGYVAADRDSRSAFGIAVRKQLAALGPTPALVLAEGVVRAQPELRSSTPAGVLAWAGVQPDLTVRGQLVAPAAALDGAAGWLSPADLAVLALPEGVLQRRQILTTLVGQGLTPGSARVWLVRCPWLRPAGSRGRYRRASEAS